MTTNSKIYGANKMDKNIIHEGNELEELNESIDSLHEETPQTNNNDNTIDNEEKNKDRLEFLVAILLGITAVFTAWATWIGSLHGGNQATNYTASNNAAAEANGLKSVGTTKMTGDLILCLDIENLVMDFLVAGMYGDEERELSDSFKIARGMNQFNYADFAIKYFEWDREDYRNAKMAEATPQEQINYVWNWATTVYENHGKIPEYVDFDEAYFSEANKKMEEAEQLLIAGNKDNEYGDSYNLVTVIYSIVLFVLGIVGVFKSMRNRLLLLCVAIFAFVIATIYMITIPLPTGFSIFNFF